METTSIKKQWYNPDSGVPPKVGDWLHGFSEARWSGKNKVGRTGWVFDGKVWVQMKEGVPTGQTRENPRNTNILGRAFHAITGTGNKSKLKLSNLTLDQHKKNLINIVDKGRANLKNKNKGFLQQLSESFDEPSGSTGNKGVDEFFGLPGKPNVNLGNYKKKGYHHYIDSDGLDAYTKLPNPNKNRLKMTKEQKKWIKENPSGTFINEYGVDEKYSPEFDLLRFHQAERHKDWLKDHGRI